MAFCVLLHSDTPAAAIRLRGNFSWLAGIAAVFIAFCCCATAAGTAAQQKYDRFLKLLQENPGPGSALNFVVRHHADNQTLEPFTASLHESAERNPEDGKGWLLAGLLELERGRADDAVTTLRRATQLMPNAPTAQHSLAISLIHSGRLQEAIRPLELALELHQNPRDIQRCAATLSRIQMRLHKPELAHTVWNQAIARFPQDFAIPVAWAQEMAEQGDYDGALAGLLTSSSRLSDPAQRLRAQIRTAEFQANFGHISEALDDLQELLKNLLPNSPTSREVTDSIRIIVKSSDYADQKIEYLTNSETLPQRDAEIAEALIEKLKEAGRKIEADHWVIRSVKIFPDSWSIRRRAVQNLEATQNYNSAARECEEFCTLVPNHEEAIETWGRLILKRRDIPADLCRNQAADVWMRLIDVEQPGADNLIRAASLLQEIDQYERALELCRRANRADPDNVQYQIMSGEVMFLLQRSEEAIALWNAIVTRPSVKSDDLFRLADAFLQHGFLDAAVHTAERAVGISTSSSDSVKLIHLYADVGRFEDALKLLLSLKKQSNESEEADLMALQVQVLVAAKRLTEETIKLAKQISDTKDPEPEELRTLAALQEASGMQADAVKTIEASLTLSPDSVPSLVIAARLLKNQQRYEEGIRICRRLADLSSTHRTAALRDVALYSLELSATDASVEAASELCRLHPDDAVQLRFLVDICVRTGRIDEGLVALRSAVQSNPANSELRSEFIRFLAGNYRTDDAIQLLRISLKEADADRDGTAVVDQLTYLCLRSGKYDQLAQTLEAETLIAADNRRAMALLGRSLSLAGYPEKAEEFLATLCPLSVCPTDILLLRSRLAVESGHPEVSASFLEQAFQRKRNTQQRAALTQMYADLGNMEGLFRIWFRPAADNPISEDFLAVIDSLVENRRHTEAARLCQLVIDQCPENWQVLFRRAALHRALMDEQSASTLFRQVYSINDQQHSVTTAFGNAHEFRQEQRAIAAACNLKSSNDRGLAAAMLSESPEASVSDLIHQCDSLMAARAMSLDLLLQSALRSQHPESFFEWHQSHFSAPHPENLRRLWMMQTLTAGDSLLSELWLGTPELSHTLAQYSVTHPDPAGQLLYLIWSQARWSFRKRFPAHHIQLDRSGEFNEHDRALISTTLQQLFDSGPEWLSGDPHLSEFSRFLIANSHQNTIREIVSHSKDSESFSQLETGVSLASAGSDLTVLRALILKWLQMGFVTQESEMPRSVSESAVSEAIAHLLRTHADQHGWAQVTEILNELEDHVPDSLPRIKVDELDSSSSSSPLDKLELFPAYPSLCRWIVNTFEQSKQLALLRGWASAGDTSSSGEKHAFRSAIACLVEQADGNERLATRLLLEHLRNIPPRRDVLLVLRHQLSQLNETTAVAAVDSHLTQLNPTTPQTEKPTFPTRPAGLYGQPQNPEHTLSFSSPAQAVPPDVSDSPESTAAERAFDILVRSTDLPLSHTLFNAGTKKVGLIPAADRNSCLRQLFDSSQLQALIRISEVDTKQSLNPKQTMVQLCDYYEVLGDSEALNDTRRRLEALELRDPQLLARRAADLERSGKTDEACEVFLTLLKSFPSMFAVELETILQSFESARKTRHLAEALTSTDLRDFHSHINTLVVLATGLTESETERQAGRALLTHINTYVPRFTPEQLQLVFQSKHFSPVEFLDLLLKTITPDAVTARRNVWYGVENQTTADLLAALMTDEHLLRIAVGRLTETFSQVDSWQGGRLWRCILLRGNSAATTNPESRDRCSDQLQESLARVNPLSLAASAAAYSLLKQPAFNASPSDLWQLTMLYQSHPADLRCSENLTQAAQLLSINVPFAALKLLDSRCGDSDATVVSAAYISREADQRDAVDRIVRGITAEQRLQWIQEVTKNAGKADESNSLDLPVVVTPYPQRVTITSEDLLTLRCSMLNALRGSDAPVSSESAQYSAIDECAREVLERESADLRLLILMTAAYMNAHARESELRQQLTDRLYQDLTQQPQHRSTADLTTEAHHLTATDIRRDLTCAVLAQMLPADASLISLKTELIRRAVTTAREAGDELQLIATLQTCSQTAVAAGMTELSNELQRESEHLCGIRRTRKFPEHLDFTLLLKQWLAL
jgi:tetratricopeptide (TPR) repeat protein